MWASKNKVKKKKVWHKQFTEASHHQDKQHHVKQTMTFSPTYDVQKEAYQLHGKLSFCFILYFNVVAIKYAKREAEKKSYKSQMILF